MRAKAKLPRGIYSRKDSPHLWGRIRRGAGGKNEDLSRCLQTSVVKVAESRMKEWREQLKAPKPVVRETWEMAVAKWEAEILPNGAIKASTAGGYLACLKAMTPHFTGKDVAAIDTRMIGAYVSNRSGKVTNATIRHDITALSALLSACNAWGWTNGTNVAKHYDRTIVRSPATVINPPTASEIELMISYAPDPMQGVLRFLWQSGARAEEAAQLTRRDVDWAGHKVTLFKTKRGKARTLAWATPGGDVTAVLSATVASLADPHVFRTQCGSSYKRLSSNFVQVKKHAKKAEAAAGRTLRDFRLHDLRHAFAVNWLKSGASIYDLSKHLGHTSIMTTEGYLHHITVDEQTTAKAGKVAAG